MTPKETTKTLIQHISTMDLKGDEIFRLIEAAITHAIEEEREACAKIAEAEMKFFIKESERLTRNDIAAIGDERAARSAQGVMLQIQARSKSKGD